MNLFWNYFSLTNEFECSCVRLFFDYIPKLLIFETLLCDFNNILTTAVIVHHVKSMRIGESTFVNFHPFAFVVHLVNEIIHVDFDILLVFA